MVECELSTTHSILRRIANSPVVSVAIIKDNFIKRAEDLHIHVHSQNKGQIEPQHLASIIYSCRFRTSGNKQNKQSDICGNWISLLSWMYVSIRLLNRSHPASNDGSNENGSKKGQPEVKLWTSEVYKTYRQKST